MSVPTAPDDRLTRHAGPVALAAGALLVIVDLGRLVLIDPDERVASLSDPLAQLVNAAYFFAFVGLLIALIAVHGRQSGRAGRLGLVAFLAAILGTMMQGGNMWFDGFAAPWLAEVLPQAFTVPKTRVLLTGAFLSYLLFSIGWVLYGVSVLRARVFPIAIGVGLMVGGILGFNSGMPPNGVPLWLTVTALGIWLLATDRTRSTPVSSAEASRSGSPLR